MIRFAVISALLVLAGCADLSRACEDVEPFRPLIRGAVILAVPEMAIPFMVTRQVSCADAEAAAERLRDQR